MNIGTIIDAAAAGDPGRAALIIDGRVISYGELAVAVEQCAARLADSGLAGERVAVVDVGSLPVDRDDARCRADRRCGGTDESRPDAAGVAGAREERRVCLGRRRGRGVR